MRRRDGFEGAVGRVAMKSLCITGGMLYVMAFGAGALSMDNCDRS